MASPSIQISSPANLTYSVVGRICCLLLSQDSFVELLKFNMADINLIIILYIIIIIIITDNYCAII